MTSTVFESQDAPQTPAFVVMVLSGMAGGMAWGIRGQYGHETGAMITGVLVGFTTLVLLGKNLTLLASARSVALFALGISVGGSMTYGQTVGLTHDGPLVGNWEALRWGMLGLAIKGGIWFGIGGGMLGMGLSGKRYHPLELGLLFSAMLAAWFAGVLLLNSPFDIEHRLLPQLYFSDHWYWEPDVTKPRHETWGGLICALLMLQVYVGGWKRDWLAFYMGCWGFAGGAIGFPAGQAVQAYHAWNAAWFAAVPEHLRDQTTWRDYTHYFNWWNMMETTFGFVASSIVGLGAWVHRRRIGADCDADEERQSIVCHPLVEWLLLAVHIRIIVAADFQSIPWVDAITNIGLTMIFLPSIAVMSGRAWPFFMALPVVAIPIAGKTIRQLVYGEAIVPIAEGWELFVWLPIMLTAIPAMLFAFKSTTDSHGRAFAYCGLLITTWVYFGLNFAFFHVPWPWQEWTGRTPNGLLFIIFAVGLTIAASVEFVRHVAQLLEQ